MKGTLTAKEYDTWIPILTLKQSGNFRTVQVKG